MKSILDIISIEEAARILYENEYRSKSVPWPVFPEKYREAYLRSAKALIEEIQKRMEVK